MADDSLEQRLVNLFAGRFDILRELAGGGMSRVFLARDLSLDREVVIKILPPELAAEVNRDRFRREVQLAARLHHPHIVPLFSAAEEGGLLYYTMPYIRGESLKGQLGAGRSFGIRETVEILLDVTDALAYAHRAGLVHRDIKPANVLREGGHAVVTDFGVAKALSSALGKTYAADMTTSGVAIGTPAYMAPEQLAGEASADHRVDIYALGLLGYELLTGQAPFRAASPQAMMAAQLTRDPEPIRNLRVETPPTLAALLQRCLEKDAARRPPSAEAVLEVLRTIDLVSGSGPVARVRPARRVFWPVLLTAAAAAAAATFVIVNRRDGSKASPARDSSKALAVAPAPPPPPPPPAAPRIDSTRLLADAMRRKDERLLRLLRDSIANAIRQQTADSIAKAREAELAAARNRTSILPFVPGVGPGTNGGRTKILTPEAFQTRAANMGPPRRVGVSIHSSLTNPGLVIAAGAVRDSIVQRLAANGRFVLIPKGDVVAGLERTRNTDSLRTWLKAELLLTINVAGTVGSDSLRWIVVLRDFSAIASYTNRSASTPTVAAAGAGDPQVISALAGQVMRWLDEMDRAPRRELP